MFKYAVLSLILKYNPIFLPLYRDSRAGAGPNCGQAVSAGFGEVQWPSPALKAYLPGSPPPPLLRSPLPDILPAPWPIPPRPGLHPGGVSPQSSVLQLIPTPSDLSQSPDSWGTHRRDNPHKLYVPPWPLTQTQAPTSAWTPKKHEWKTVSDLPSSGRHHPSRWSARSSWPSCYTSPRAPHAHWGQTNRKMEPGAERRVPQGHAGDGRLRP